jgi:hypothetical protein
MHEDSEAAVEERVYAPPPRFDTAIGYWTGEPDEPAVARALEAVERQSIRVNLRRCRMGHLHLRGQGADLAAAEAALAAVGQFGRVATCNEAR